mmetsp:Transcript_6228/g.11134  ORF Transcript_6228/g.11134 Transcript_6228/m.11134 type:complete len:340 (-) Transcript_6228:750-1769(-)
MWFVAKIANVRVPNAHGCQLFFRLHSCPWSIKAPPCDDQSCQIDGSGADADDATHASHTIFGEDGIRDKESNCSGNLPEENPAIIRWGRGHLRKVAVHIITVDFTVDLVPQWDVFSRWPCVGGERQIEALHMVQSPKGRHLRLVKLEPFVWMTHLGARSLFVTPLDVLEGSVHVETTAGIVGVARDHGPYLIVRGRVTQVQVLFVCHVVPWIGLVKFLAALEQCFHLRNGCVVVEPKRGICICILSSRIWIDIAWKPCRHVHTTLLVIELVFQPLQLPRKIVHDSKPHAGLLRSGLDSHHIHTAGCILWQLCAPHRLHIQIRLKHASHLHGQLLHVPRP